jgi:hypothetical protein
MMEVRKKSVWAGEGEAAAITDFFGGPLTSVEGVGRYNPPGRAVA